MKPITLFLTIFCISSLACKSESKEVKHIFYLHGRIIENQGINAISEKFGKYEYQDIIDTFKTTGAELHNVIRTTQTDFQEFCERTSMQIDSLIEKGVNPKSITVIGASKGAAMAMNVSHLNKQPINYVLLAANNDQIEHDNDWTLNGRILGIYEKSDSLAGKNYQYWINRSTNAIHFKEVEINTGLGHGFLYLPIDEWWFPTRKWIEN